MWWKFDKGACYCDHYILAMGYCDFDFGIMPSESSGKCP